MTEDRLIEVIRKAYDEFGGQFTPDELHAIADAVRAEFCVHEHEINEYSECECCGMSGEVDYDEPRQQEVKE